MNNYLKFVVFAALLCCSIQTDLPSNFQTCKRSSDDFNECLKAAIQDALPKCDNGIPDLNIPVLQPLHVPEATVGEGATGAVRVVQHYKDIKLYNFTHVKIDRAEAVITDTECNFTMAGIMPDFVWNSDYDFNGQILLIPMTGKGKNYITANRVKISISFVGELYEKKGQQYIKINSVKMDFSPLDFHVKFENLFNGNERLGEEMNKILNTNWRELWADTKPNYEALFETILLDYVNRIFKKVPLNKIFPL